MLEDQKFVAQAHFGSAMGQYLTCLFIWPVMDDMTQEVDVSCLFLRSEKIMADKFDAIRLFKFRV